MKFSFARVRKFATKRVLTVCLIVAGVLVVANLLTFAVYHNRSYPNTSVAGKPLGSVKSSSLESRVRDMQLLPAEAELKYNEATTKVAIYTLGVSIDYDQTKKEIISNRSWLPLANFLTSHKFTLRLKADEGKLKKEVDAFAADKKQAPVNARVILQDNTFRVQNETAGHELDSAVAYNEVISQLASGQAAVSLPVKTLEAKIKGPALEAAVQTLKKQQQTPLTFRYQDKSKTYSSTEIAGWYVAEDGPSMVLSDVKIQASLVQLGASYGINVQNLAQGLAAAKDALTKNKNLDFTLVAAPKVKRSYAYCTATRGVDASFVPGLDAKLASVFADKRSWGLDGLVGLSKTSSGCNFTVWLSAASQMSSFGSICDAEWSCRVGPNVVINFNRWQGASASWNASGGSLEDYRVMVINHEVGHWFGFGHANCGAAGQLAPVMQQQSIDLQGCKFNPWPLPSELTALKTSLGI